jgi:lipoprotein-releasing system permease protein
MYKLLLCWRYLRTRYIALVCIVSVTLGVATMIVVNSVMAGFTAKMESEMNAMLGDLVLQVHSMDGAPDAEAHMAVIRSTMDDDIVGMSPMAAVPALVYMQYPGGISTRPITLVGIDERTYASVSSLGTYLQHPDNRRQLSFNLHETGYDQVDHLATDPAAAKPLEEMEYAGAAYRRDVERQKRRQEELYRQSQAATSPAKAAPNLDDPFAGVAGTATPSAAATAESSGQLPGIILATSEVTFTDHDGVVRLFNRPGDDVRISYPKASIPPEPLSGTFTIVDVYREPMRADTSSIAFVSLSYLQRARGLIDPMTGIGRFNSIQMKLAPGVDANAVRDKLRKVFDPQVYSVSTWQDNQAMLIHAIQTETAVLNILLFFIVAVAGFGILAIFYMIVVEKTRDIGILKSLGASGRGVMGIFLAYGLSLGLVGAGAGVALGIAFSSHINEVADLLEWVQGSPVFDPSVYFFQEIPTLIDPWTITWIVSGAVGIAVLASVLPARRAARLHPVRALRFE